MSFLCEIPYAVRTHIHVHSPLRRGFCKDKRIIGVLKDGTRQRGGDGVRERTISKALDQQLGQDIGDSIEEVREEWVSLAKPVSTRDPRPGDPIQHDRSFTSDKNVSDPVTPEGRESACL